MKRIFLLVLCAVAWSAPRATAQQKWPPQGSQYGDQRTPQGALRAFAESLSKADLARAATYLDEAKPDAKLAEIASAMKKSDTRYAIGHLQIAQNDDVTTIAFDLVIGSDGTYPSWAVLQRREGAWMIDATRTLNISDSIGPFASFVSLLSGQRLPGEKRGDTGTQMGKLLDLGRFINGLAENNKGRYISQNAQLRQALLPNHPTVDVLLRGAQDEQPQISFNSKLSGVSREKVRFPNRTVLLYTGKNGKLAYNRAGVAFVTFVRGFVAAIRPSDEQSLKLLWSP